MESLQWKPSQDEVGLCAVSNKRSRIDETILGRPGVSEPQRPLEDLVRDYTSLPHGINLPGHPQREYLDPTTEFPDLFEQCHLVQSIRGGKLLPKSLFVPGWEDTFEVVARSSDNGLETLAEPLISGTSTCEDPAYVETKME